ncbi:MAG: hypothetical protein JWR85_1494 [Marmoricola sp.]|nr:hypothetical protein [Marmoricola sp.]
MTAAAEVENAFAGQGSVLLDIGGDVGALVVTMPAAMVDVEVEIRPARADHRVVEHVHHPHVAVVERPVAGAVVPSLVFPELVEGRYELYVKATDDVRLTVAVRGGEVTDASWPG